MNFYTGGKNGPNLSTLLPEQAAGWRRGTDIKTFNRKNLYDYINGGAELYLSYGFQSVISSKYTHTGKADILVELFDMGNSLNAFGIFAHTREKIDTTFGQGSQYTDGLLLFWKNQYYISILTFEESDESKKTIFKLADMIEMAIEQMEE